MAPRAVWKGFLKFGAVSCAVKLTGATSEAEKVRFRTLNRKTRNPVKMSYVDEVTGEPVEREGQIKGYELGDDEYLQIEEEEIKQLKVASEHTLEIDKFVERAAVENIWLEKPYYIYPADRMAQEPYAIIREALRRKKMGGLANLVLYQRERPVLVEPLGKLLLMTTMRYENQVVAAKDVFGDMKKVKIDPEMAEIATMIVDKKVGRFDPAAFEDRYENALLDLIRAKQAGKKPPKPTAAPRENVVNLADVLRKSLEKEGGKTPARKQPAARKVAGRKSA
jgi:DNA end-binding protein Ku